MLMTLMKLLIITSLE